MRISPHHGVHTTDTRPSEPANGDDPKPGLQRAKTTITVPADARDRIRAANAGGPPAPSTPPKTSPTGLGRSATSGGRAPGAPVPLGLNGPTRGLSIRKGGSPTAAQGPGAQGQGQGAGGRMTEFYDDYLDGYTGEEAAEVPPLPSAEGRVANWVKGPGGAVGRNGTVRSAGAPPSSYAPSAGLSAGGGSVRRKLTRRGTGRGPASRAGSSFYGGYEEEEEGYVSGEYEDVFEMVKIRVKVRFPPSLFFAPLFLSFSRTGGCADSNAHDSCTTAKKCAGWRCSRRRRTRSSWRWCSASSASCPARSA